MDIKVISRNVGMALLVSALFMLISMFVSWTNGMDSAFAPLAISFVITFTAGIFPFIFVRSTKNISKSDGFMIIVLSWVLSFIFGMLPYVLWGGEFTLINAWFESVSGYTTTGGTILTDIEALPKGLLFWRSSTHFIGGLGVVVFMLFILPASSSFRLKLANMEISSLTKEGYTNLKSKKMVNVIVLVYIGLVAAETILLMLAGMSFFDAVNHSFSTIATGGFSTKNNSIAYFDSPVINIILIVFMLLSSLHFGVIYAMVSTRSFKPLNNPVSKFFLGTAAVIISLITVVLLTSGTYDNFGEALMAGAFQATSVMTTTGFATADNNTWPLVVCILMLYCSFQCGCSGSTNGGVKSDRLLILLKGLYCQIQRSVHPNTVSMVRVGKHTVKDEAVLQVVMFILFYIVILFVSSILLLLIGVGPAEAFSGPITCMSNSGPGMGAIGTMGNYAMLPTAAKFILTLNMAIGRVEIYPVIIAFMLLFRRNKD